MKDIGWRDLREQEQRDDDETAQPAQIAPKPFASQKEPRSERMYSGRTDFGTVSFVKERFRKPMRHRKPSSRR